MAVSAPRPAGLGPPTALLLIIINALWGGSSLAAKVVLAQVPPLFLAFVRFALAAVLLYAMAGKQGVEMRVARRDWILFWATGVLGISLSYLLTYAGLRRTTAADSALLHAAEPVFVLLLSVGLLGERLWGRQALGIAGGLAGALLIASRGYHPSVSGAAGGDLLIAAGLLSEALSVIVGKRLVTHYPPLTVLTYQMLTGALFLAPCTIWQGIQSGWRLPSDFGTWPTLWPVLMSLLYLIFPCTVFAYTIWYSLLGRHAASDLSVFLFVQPVFGAILGVVFQHDPLSGSTVAGALLILLALALIHRPAQAADVLPPA